MELLGDIIYQTFILTISFSLLLSVVTVIGVLWKLGYIQKLPYYNQVRNAIIMQGINTMASSDWTGLFMPKYESANVGLSKFELDDNKEYAYGEIMFNNIKYMLFLPYDKGLSRRMRMKSTYLLSEDKKVNINHPPGIRHNLSAKQLGGHTIMICNNDDDVLEQVTDTDKLTYKF